MTGQVAVIEELVALGMDAAVHDAVASTPMHVAAGEGHLEAILALQRLVRLPLHTPSDRTEEHQHHACLHS